MQIAIEEHTLGELIREAARVLDMVIASETTPLPIPAPMSEVLYRLLKNPGQSQVSLARQVAMDASTMGRAVDRLIAQGFLTRQRSAEDKRAWSLHLTDAGGELAGRVTRIFDRIEGEVAGELGRADYERVRALLVRFLEVSETLYRDERQG